MAATDFKTHFIEAAIASGVLLFGEFTLKSGRKSPYFFNAGLLYDGKLLAATADAFASTIQGSLPAFDVLFGPAYKGIPLAAVTAVALANRGVDTVYTYNRKEKKDHGEGGVLVGAPLEGRRIVVIDDVMTAGTAIRESIAIIKEQRGQLVGIVQLVDRQERGKEGTSSTIQEVEREFGIPVVPIINLTDIIAYLKTKGGYEAQVKAIEEYRAQYGVAA
ncbi:orotate phosphoribosyltransferase [Vanrija albida]|uniref:orotate phosphoribosyltransferase n=1 Tax=Vanrija albida TaxID=181172 RepID=A0ABR3Q7Y5_9TREE